jgi:mannose-1-phosphate guanylyltransferase
MTTDLSLPWALVLAGGEGSRLRALTTAPCGTPVPKQFCSLDGGTTLIEDAIARGSDLVSSAHVCAIVGQNHREWWSQIGALSHLPKHNVIVQPRNRGTAVGVLYSLVHIMARDPDANIVLLPADHYVRDEATLQSAMHLALEQLRDGNGDPVLLGIAPEEVDPELGYILPGAPDRRGAFSVERFIEKPTSHAASELIASGGMWNAFIIAASARNLVNLFFPRYAPLAMEMHVIVNRALNAHGGSGWPAIVDMYERLPHIDFSRDLLEGRESQLRVVRVPSCGWSDLGTPRRVAETLRRKHPALEESVQRPKRATTTYVPINLAAQHAVAGTEGVRG